MDSKDITNLAIIIATPFVNFYNGVVNTGKPAVVAFVLFVVIAIIDGLTQNVLHSLLGFFQSLSFGFAAFFTIAGLVGFDLKPINLFDKVDETKPVNEDE